jgi:hypothetical protein
MESYISRGSLEVDCREREASVIDVVERENKKMERIFQHHLSLAKQNLA